MVMIMQTDWCCDWEAEGTVAPPKKDITQVGAGDRVVRDGFLEKAGES